MAKLGQLAALATATMMACGQGNADKLDSGSTITDRPAISSPSTTANSTKEVPELTADERIKARADRKEVEQWRAIGTVIRLQLMREYRKCIEDKSKGTCEEKFENDRDRLTLPHLLDLAASRNRPDLAGEMMGRVGTGPEIPERDFSYLNVVPNLIVPEPTPPLNPVFPE